MRRKSAQQLPPDDLRPEYDFTTAAIGKHHKRYTRRTNLVRLDEDVAREFPTSEAVNDALRRFRDIRRVVTATNTKKPK